jgi:hypothetical protein
MSVALVHHFHAESGTVQHVGPGVQDAALTIKDGLVEVEAVQVDGDSADVLECRKISACRLVLLAAALLRLFTRRTASGRPKTWVKFVPCVRALCSWLCSWRVSELSCIACDHVVTHSISVVSRLAAPPTRLETRSKDSNMWSSHWV